MDKRVEKTIRSIRNALLELLRDKEFDRITVKEICERAEISRITFYNYFKDKYDLMNDMFQLLETKSTAYFLELEKANNPDNDPAIGFHNLLSAIFDASQENLLAFPKLLNNPDLILAYYHFATGIIEKYENWNVDKIHTKYDLKRLNAFLIMSFWAYARLGGNPCDTEQLKKETKQLIEDLSKCAIFG